MVFRQVKDAQRPNTHDAGGQEGAPSPVGPWCLLWWMDFIEFERKKTKFQLQKLGFNQQTRGFVTSTVGFGSFLLWSDFRWYHLTNLLTLAGLAGSSVATAVRTPLTARDTLHQP